LRGLAVDSANSALLALKTKITDRDALLKKNAAARRAREEKLAAEAAALKAAFKLRKVSTRTTSSPPDLEDATARLSDPLDASSTLSLPLLILYPLAGQTDLIKAWDESTTVGSHLEYLLPAPWDASYTVESVECYVPTAVGGLVKAGKKVALRKLLESGKCEVVDGLLSLYVVTKERAAEWIEQWKVTRGVRK